METLDVLSSAKFIASHSKYVKVNEKGVKKGVNLILKEWPLRRSNHAHNLEPPNLSDKEVLEWLFLVDTLNFCFWSDSDDTLFTMEYNGQQWNGSYSLSTCLQRAVEEGILIYKPSVYGHITQSQLNHIFRSSNGTEIPLLSQRLENLREAARVLDKEFHGDVRELVRQCNKSAYKLVHLMAEKFASYRDIGTYKERPVAFLKRAQIFVADVWSRFGGKGYGEFTDIGKLTMFADYRVPQALLHIGALEYREDLMTALKKGTHLEAGSEEEMEIRGCSIWAIELIRKGLLFLLPQEMQSDVLACELDYYFWRYAKSHSKSLQLVPIHKTLTIFY